MILVLGHIKLGKGAGETIRPMLAAHMATVQQEHGCEMYSFAIDAADPDLIRIAERWTDPAALAAHGEAAHQKAFGRALKDYPVEDISVQAWDGEFWRTLIGK